MKKVIATLLALVLVLCLSVGAVAEGIQFALVTDVGNIDDQSFNQGTWEGLVAYATAKGLTEKTDYAYYRPTEDSDDARVETMKAAIDNGAKVIVIPGYLFDSAVLTVAAENPEVMFLGVDLTENPDFPANVNNIAYKEEIAGYCAGYAAVKDGYTKLGFLGGIDVPAVIRYGFGFVQGADAAAKEMGINVDMKYWYSASFAPTDEIKGKMDSWYADGTEIVFSCGGGILQSALAAAEAVNGKVIGVDTDQSAISDLIVTSAFKILPGSVQVALEKLEANGGVWPEELAGKTTKYGTETNSVGLPTNDTAWRFQTYTVAEYETMYAGLSDGSIVVSNDIENQPATTNVTVDYQN